ncbi:EAL domain-containing protein [Actinotalea sp. BY-33]|uniref:EAL domain-containing protein n=1 Tax=Actinotalea soli TaxID=2819234 RepID=A0A939LRU7_9CELL|nr:EAL domain-containing protein [Actinotalea soli]MBO1752688.1 EAL domain-containing protein [Actinotalea soli]
MAAARADAASPALARADRALAWAPWLVLALGAGTAALVPGDSGSTPVRITLVVTLGVFFTTLVVRLLVVAALRPARRVPLLFLAGAVAVWAVGSASVSLGQTVTAVTFPAPGEFLCFASYLAMAAFLLVDRPRRSPLTGAVWLEALVVCGAAVCLAAFPLLMPLTTTFGSGGVALLLAVAYPLINVVMFGVVLAQVLVRHREPSLASVALLLGFLGLAVADSTFLLGHDDGTYSTSLVLAALWGASFALVVAGACERRVSVVAPEDDGIRSAVLLASAAGLALVMLMVDPPGLVGWSVKIPALVTLVGVGARMTIALREARGAAEAMRLSMTDELTGLPNRRALLSVVDTRLRSERSIGVVLLDLDGFKDVNDSLGHMVGDEVLVTLAHRMRANLDHRITLARLGGDEFALVVPSDDVLSLHETAQRLRTVLKDRLRVRGLDLSLDASVGITVRQPEDQSSTELLRRADIAMYQAKQTGAGTLLFDPAHDGLAQHRLSRSEALRQAVTTGQLVVWYQPQVDARTGGVVAVEALVRWRHPTEGLLSPVAFLADARASGLMAEVTEVVLRRVLADTRRWAEAGFTFRVAMNWAPPELVGGRILPQLISALDDATFPADRLMVEVTEDSFLAEPERAREALLELRRHGVQVAIDDYGTGFSSLSYLRDLPVQEIKMDRSFITPVATDERSRMIVQTTAQMARAFGLRLVAEGVEDQAAAAELLPMGVDVLQGFHVARPMPASEVAPWVRRRQAERFGSPGTTTISLDAFGQQG